MATAQLVLDRDFTLGPVPRRLFGSFVEHMGRCVYTGIHEPGHPTADAEGLRGDVLDLTREIGPTVVRYPGGNFVSGYRWEDGVGPQSERPRRPDLAWHSIETNAFGVHEFDDWARKAGTEVMMAVNLGTRGVQEACDLLEYTNLPTGTAWADRRAAHGHPEPFGYRLWCLGNEMDGPWQIGHTTAEAYGRTAAATARAMRMLDPTIELVACGSSGRGMATFGDWETTVLEHCYDDVDYISLHTYFSEGDDVDSYLASAMGMDAYIEDVIAVVDAVRARGGHRKQVDLSFDEWNAARPSGDGEGDRRPWQEHPAIAESDYTLTDAVAVGTYLNALLRHGDRVTVACQAQLVNVLGLIRTEEGGPAWQQPIAYPFAQMRRLARGAILRVEGAVDRYDTADYTDVPAVDVTATFDEETGRAAVFLAHRGLDEPARVSLDVRDLGVTRVREATVLHPAEGQDRHTGNAVDHDAVRPRPFDEHRLADGRLEAVLPPLSWTVFELAGDPARRDRPGPADDGRCREVTEVVGTLCGMSPTQDPSTTDATTHDESASARTAWGWGLATVSDAGQVLDTWFPKPMLGAATSETQAPAELIAAAGGDPARAVRTEVVKVAVHLDEPPAGASDAYLRLHLLSHRLVRPRTINLDGIFGVLTNVVWTSAGPCAVDGFEQVRARLRRERGHVTIHGVDKFPRMVDYVLPAGVRISDADRVRLGAHLAEGTTVMHEGFVNYNAGTLGVSMVEGRISQGVVVGDGSDIGGGASIMGTLSGGGTEVVSIGRRCLVGANAGLAIPLGDDCVIEAGLYVTAGTKVTLPDGTVVKAVELAGQDGLLFIRNSLTGGVEVRTRGQRTVELNAALHAN